MLTFPDIELPPTFPAQAGLDTQGLQAITAFAAGGGVLSGCGVTAQSSPNMTVQVAAGILAVAGTAYSVGAVGSLAIAAASTTDRKDVVIYRVGTGVMVLQGTPCGTAGWTATSSNPNYPVKPALTFTTDLLLAEIYVEGTGATATTSITTGNIVDQTLTIAMPPFTAGGDLTGTFPAPTIKASVALTGAPTAPTPPISDSSTRLATTAFVSALVDGADYKAARQLATTAALPTNTYANGASGVGATLTGVDLTGAALVIDGTSNPAIGTTVLVKNEVAGAHNGAYVVQTVAAVGTAWVLIRATDYNQAAEMAPGDAFYIYGGSSGGNLSTTWVMNQSAAITVGTTALTFVQIQGIGSITSGAGITITGTSIAMTTPPLTPGATQTANFTALANLFYPINTTAGTFTGTLPAAPANGTVVGFKITVSTTPATIFTVAAGGSDVLNVAGTTSATIKVFGEVQQWIYFSGVWYAYVSTPVGQLDLRYPLNTATPGGDLAAAGSTYAVPLLSATANVKAIIEANSTPFPLPGAVDFMGHSYMGATDLGLPEPMMQAKYVASRIAAALGATPDSVTSFTQGGGRLLSTDTDGCGWGTALQRWLPPTAVGLAAQSGGAYQLGGQVNPPLPATSLPTFVGLHGINDVVYPFGGGFTPFTASANGSGTLTSSTNLSSTGSYLAGRIGGNGIQVGDYLLGAGIRGAAQVASVTWNGSNLTTIVLTTVGQNTAPSTSVSYNLIPNNFATQGKAAIINAASAVVQRRVAGAIVRSDDAAITYSGTWTTVTQNGGNTGPTIRQSIVNNSALSYTFPATHPGGMVGFIFVGTNDLDASGCTVTAGGTSAAGVLGAVTTVGRAGWCGLNAPVLVRIKTTAADAGKTITFTFGTGSGGTPVLQFDSINFDAQYQSPVILVTQPLVVPDFDGAADPVTNIPALNAALARVVTNFQTAPAGGFPAIGPITPAYTNVVLADFATEINKKSFYLGSSILATGSTSSSVTLVGQRTTTQGDQLPPYAGQQLGISCNNVGDLNEVVFVTSVAAGSPVTIGGSTYPTWTVNMNRNINPSGFAAFQQNAATGSITSLVSPVADVMWMGPDYIHPGDVGAALIASNVLQAYQSVPTTANPDFIAASGQRWLQGRTTPYPRALDGGIWTPKGIEGTFTPVANTVYAMRYYASEWQLITGVGVSVVAQQGNLMYAAFLLDTSNGSYPGMVICDFGLADVALSSNTSLGLLASGGDEYLLAPGSYWVAVGFNSATVSTVRGVATRTDEPNVDWISLTELNTEATTYGKQGYTWTPATTGAAITSMAVAGTPAPIVGGTTAQMPRIWVQRTVQKYNFAG